MHSLATEKKEQLITVPRQADKIEINISICPIKFIDFIDLSRQYSHMFNAINLFIPITLCVIQSLHLYPSIHLSVNRIIYPIYQSTHLFTTFLPWPAIDLARPPPLTGPCLRSFSK
jgi:hypothetical protein